jgi:hypothetical protein
VFGVLVSGAVSATTGPRIVGASGYLDNAIVKYRGGDRICRDPWVWVEGDQPIIECNRPR